MAMEFWGVEVKNGEILKVDPGKDMLVHISQATIGERKKDKAGETVYVYLSVNNQKFVLGSLSHDRFPQLTTEIVLEKKFELSHNWKNGSVYLTGYKVDAREDDGMPDHEDDAEDMRPVTNDNGEHESKLKEAKHEAKKADDKKLGAVSKQVHFKEPNKNVRPKQEDADSEDEDGDIFAEDSSANEVLVVTGEESSDESNEDDDDESSEEITPKKPEPSKKRPSEDAVKAPGDKKLKSAYLQKTGGKESGGHMATPYPKEQAGKKPDNTEQSLKSAKPYSCKSCNRSFTSEVGLQTHAKARHSAAA